MLFLSELRRDWRRYSTSRRMRLLIGSAAIFGCAMTAGAQEKVPSGAFLVTLDGGIKAETVSISLQEACFARQFCFVYRESAARFVFGRSAPRRAAAPPPGKHRNREAFPGGRPQRPLSGYQVRLCQ